MNPLETLRRAKLEQKMTSNVQAASKVHRQYNEKQPNGEDVDKKDDRTRVGQRNVSKELGTPIQKTMRKA